VLADLPTPIRLVDCGCGSADLTFAVYHYLNHVLRHPAQAVGVDVKADLIAKHNAISAELGWDDLRFEVSRIIDYVPGEPPDIVIALHACDTATDEALAQAVKWGARMIFSAPCCHHDLQVQISAQPMPPAFRPVLRHGILKERIGDVLTDALRAQILRIVGYRTDVVEFISPEHTDKNLMIRAVSSTGRGDVQMLIDEYRDLVDLWQVQPTWRACWRRSFWLSESSVRWTCRRPPPLSFCAPLPCRRRLPAPSPTLPLFLSPSRPLAPSLTRLLAFSLTRFSAFPLR
jgi:SAM-dependent methyltransferase